MTLLAVRENPKWWPATIFENVKDHISATGHAIHFVFGSMVGF